VNKAVVRLLCFGIVDIFLYCPRDSFGADYSEDPAVTELFYSYIFETDFNKQVYGAEA